MKFDDFLNTLAQKARHERFSGFSPRDIILQRIADSDTGTFEEDQWSLLWVFTVSGVAACLSVLVSFDAYTLLMDPLGLFIGILGNLPLEI